MPFHVFLSQSLSLVTGGLDEWKVAKDILAAVLALFTFCIVIQQKRSTRLSNTLLGLGVVYGILHIALWIAHPHIYRPSALLGTLYNNRLWLYGFIGLGAALLTRQKQFNQTALMKVVLGVSTIVAALGVAQYFLPHTLLTHFGYGPKRGTVAAFYIDNRPNFPRIMSSLRDPNSLGAYLILPLTLLTSLMFRAVNDKQRALLMMLAGLHLIAIFLTFSRSAWVGAALSVGLLLLWQYSSKIMGLLRRWWPVAASVLLIGMVATYTARNTYVFKSVVSHHTGAPQGVAYDSNGFHWVFAKRGLEGIVRNPFGHGPGTAGLASIQNPAGSFLTENYYIQIGYEVGVLGLLLFLAINVVLYRQLWRRRDSPLSAMLLCSSWAYVLVNMLLHMWSNEAVAAQWWLLAGFVAGLPTSAVGSKKLMHRS